MPYDLKEFIQERNEIQRKKENGESAPWTTDEVLAKHHFCNIDRMHDAFSIWLSSKWYGQFPPNTAKVASAVVARYFNSPAVLSRLLIPDLYNVRPAYVEAAEAGERLFNYQAYFRANRVHTVRIVRQAIAMAHLVQWSNATLVYKDLKEIPHIGPFLSSQITLDLVQYRNLPLVDWIPIGPGSARGIMRHLNWDMKNSHMSAQMTRVGIKDIASRLGTNVIIAEHALCEWDKYLRIIENPKKGRKYNPGSATLLKARGKK